MPGSMSNAATSLAAVDSYPAPDWFYYEAIECGRRMLLTGVLIFIASRSSTQTATACIFAFGSILGFELMRPHLDPADSWLYRLVSRGALSILIVNETSYYIVCGVWVLFRICIHVFKNPSYNTASWFKPPVQRYLLRTYRLRYLLERQSLVCGIVLTPMNSGRGYHDDICICRAYGWG